MKSFLCITVGVVFSLVQIAMLSLHVYADVTLKSEATVMEYETPCDIGLPEYLPSKTVMQFLKAGNYSIGTCQTFGTQYGHPAAVVVTFENPTETDQNVTIQQLSSIRLKAKAGISPAIALIACMRSRFTNQMEIQFITADNIKITTSVAPGKKVQLIFFFPTAKKGDVIYVGDTPPVTIR